MRFNTSHSYSFGLGPVFGLTQAPLEAAAG